MSSVREVDHGWDQLLHMMREAAKLRTHEVRVGFVGNKAEADHGPGSPLTNAELAIIQEYGAPAANISARPFVSASFDKNRQKYQAELAKGMVKVFGGTMNMEQLLGLIGAQASADMKAYVTQGAPIPPPNAPATIAAKGSDRTLVDTGRMVGAITWQVETGKGDE